VEYSKSLYRVLVAGEKKRCAIMFGWGVAIVH